MAARQEIIDFINAERNTNVLLTNEEVNTLIFRILKIYSERKADIVTLRNDLLDMVIGCRTSERLGAKEYVISDFTIAIELLLQTSKDWQVFLPESEINRYEGKRLGNIKNLANYIRKLYGGQIYEDKFRWKYSFIEPNVMDYFLIYIHNMDKHQIRRFYMDYVYKEGIKIIEFLEDVLPLCPERYGDRWSVQTLRRK